VRSPTPSPLHRSSPLQAFNEQSQCRRTARGIMSAVIFFISRAMFTRSNDVGHQHAIRNDAFNALIFVKHCDLSLHQEDSSCSGFPQLGRNGLESGY